VLRSNTVAAGFRAAITLLLMRVPLILLP
jgi:hypothetical protein